MSEPTQRCDICGCAYFGVAPDGICPSCEKAAQANEEQRGVREENAALRAEVDKLKVALAIASKQPRFDLKIYDTDQTERETLRYLTYLQLSAVSGELKRMHVRHKIIPVPGTP